jgi:hypothetical protein
LLVFLASCSTKSSGGNEDSGFNIENYAKTNNLSLAVKTDLAYMGNEEKLAYDVYIKLYSLYPNVNQFTNIATKSETKHISGTQSALLRYSIKGSDLSDSNFTEQYNQNKNIEDMKAGIFGVPAIQKAYYDLIAEGTDVIGALKAACKIEVDDINDLDKYLIDANKSNAKDIIALFEFLRKGSYKHYWSFDSALKNKDVLNGCNLGDGTYGDKSGIYPN